MGLQREVALIPDDVWRAGPKAVIAAIAEIEARYAASSNAEDIDAILTRLPPATAMQKATFAQSVTAYRPVLPTTLAQILEFCSQEINRLQGRNEPYPDLETEADARRQIRVLTTIRAALHKLYVEIPREGALTDANIEKGERLTRLIFRSFQEWPRKNVEDMTDSVYRLALVGGCTALAPMLGVSATVATGVGVALFGGKKIADAIKASKDITGL